MVLFSSHSFGRFGGCPYLTRRLDGWSERRGRMVLEDLLKLPIVRSCAALFVAHTHCFTRGYIGIYVAVMCVSNPPPPRRSNTWYSSFLVPPRLQLFAKVHFYISERA